MIIFCIVRLDSISSQSLESISNMVPRNVTTGSISEGEAISSSLSPSLITVLELGISMVPPLRQSRETTKLRSIRLCSS